MVLQTNPTYDWGLGIDLAAVVDSQRFEKWDLPTGGRPAVGEIPYPNSKSGPRSWKSPPAVRRTASDVAQRPARKRENKTTQFLRSHHPQLAEMVDLGLPVRQAFGLAARERFSGGESTTASGPIRPQMLPNPHPAYDNNGRRISPPQYGRAEMDAFTLQQRNADPNLVRGALFDAARALGASPGQSSLFAGPVSLLPGIGDLADIDDTIRALERILFIRNHLTGFTCLLARRVPCSGLNDHKWSATQSSGRVNPAFGGSDRLVGVVAKLAR